MARSKRRAGYVDVTRGFAIVLGLFSHVMLTSGAWETLKEISPALYGLRLLTRFATPTFIVLFGISMSLAYSERWATVAGPTLVRGKLARRSLKCYISLAVIGIAGLLGGVVNGADFLGGLAFLAPIFNADIFAFYAVGMLAAMILIPLVHKIGSIPTLLGTLAWWPIAYFAAPLAPADERLGFLVSRVFGIGLTYGPSVFHALPLVVSGMIIGRLIRETQEGLVSKEARRAVAITLSLSTFSVIFLVFVEGPVGMVIKYVSATEYRNNNHFGYFAIGLLAATLIIVCAYALTEVFRRDHAWKAGPFGASSLLSFATGNVIINLLGDRLKTDNPFVGIAMAVALISLVWVGLKVWLLWRASRLRADTRVVPAS